MARHGGRGHGIDKDVRKAAEDELVRLIATGTSLDSCANRLGFSEATLRKWLKSPSMELRVARMKAAVIERSEDTVEQAIQSASERAKSLIEAALEQAVGTLVDKMGSDRESIALKAADSILDRHESTAKNKKTRSEAAVLVLSAEQLSLAARAAAEASLSMPAIRPMKVIEAVPEEIPNG